MNGAAENFERLGQKKCVCCGVLLPADNRYYALDQEFNELKDYPLCCECAA